MAIIATTAKASLTSKRSTSSTLQPARASALRIAGTGRGGEQARLMGVGAVAGDAGDRRQAQRLGHRGAHQHQGRGAVADRGGVGGGDRPVLGERRLQGRESWPGRPSAAARRRRRSRPACARRPAPERSRGRRRRSRPPPWPGAGSRWRRRPSPRGRTDRLRRALLGEGAHQLAGVIGVLQPVEVHAVADHVVADAGAAAVLGQQVGGVGHALHAAGDDDLGGAGGQRVVRHDRRLHARAAHLVDGGRLHRLGQARAQRRLARRRLAEAGRAARSPSGSARPRSDATPARSTAALAPPPRPARSP